MAVVATTVGPKQDSGVEGEKDNEGKEHDGHGDPLGLNKGEILHTVAYQHAHVQAESDFGPPERYMAQCVLESASSVVHHFASDSHIQV